MSTFSFDETLSVLSDGLRKHPRVRIWFTAFSVFILVVVSLALLFSSAIFSDEILKQIVTAKPLLFIASLMPLFVALKSYTDPSKSESERLREELKQLREERKRIEEHVPDSDKDVFYTVRLNINRLDEYYTVNIEQARSSFRVSVFCIVLGFVVITTGAWLYFVGKDSNLTMTIITVIAGTIIEFIGATCFVVYDKSIKQLNKFFGQLVVAQDTMLAIKLCEQISPPETQNTVREKIVFNLLGRCSRDGQSHQS